MGTNRSIGILAIINLVGSLLSILYSVAQAHLFGVSREIEIFFAAQMLFMSIQKISQTGHLNGIFLPIYHQIRENESQKKAQEAFSVLLNWLLLFSLLTIFLLWTVAPWIVNTVFQGFSASDNESVLRMFRVILLLLPFQITNTFIAVPLNAEKMYGRQELVSTMDRLLFILILLGAYQFLGTWALVLSLAVGVIVQFSIFVTLFVRQHFCYRFSLKKDGFNHWSVLKKLSNTLLYVVCLQVYEFALVSTITLLPSGYYAAFQYVRNIVSRVQGILLRPVQVVFFTEVSEAISQNSVKVIDLMSVALKKAFAICAATFILVVVSGRTGLSFLWGNEKFGPSYLDFSYWLLVMFFGIMVLPAMQQIYDKVNLSFGFIKAQYGGASFIQLLSAALTWWLVPAFGMNGLICVILLNMLFHFLNPFMIVYYRKPNLIRFPEIKLLGQWFLLGFLPILAYYGNLGSKSHWWENVDGRFQQILILGVILFVISLWIVLGGTVLGIREIKAVRNYAVKFLKKGFST